MMHDDGQMQDNYEEADVLLIGVSRSSKTPTSIYLANRGIKTANIPLVPNVAAAQIRVQPATSFDRRPDRVAGTDHSNPAE